MMGMPDQPRTATAVRPWMARLVSGAGAVLLASGTVGWVQPSVSPIPSAYRATHQTVRGPDHVTASRLPPPPGIAQPGSEDGLAGDDGEASPAPAATAASGSASTNTATFSQPTQPSPVMTATFDAVADPDPTSTIPPDTDGAVGPNNVVVAENQLLRFQTRTGTVISTTTVNALFGALAQPNGISDPRLRYDPYAGRWMLAAITNVNTSQAAVLIGVSQTSDPTGTWNTYSVAADPTGQTWAEFPGIGFDKDWIVVAANLYQLTQSVYVNTKIWVFNKSTLYAGQPLSASLFTVTDGNHVMQPTLTYDPNQSTLYLIEDMGATASQWRVSSITGPVGSETLTVGSPFSLGTGITWAQNGTETNGGFAPQLGTSELIYTSDSRIHSVVFRNGSLWAAQTIFLPTSTVTRSSVQWAQLSASLTPSVQQVGRVDDPNGVLFFAYPSLAVNSRNDMLIGYSRYSANQYASADYSFREGGDPAGTLRADTVLEPGGGPYNKGFNNTRNRWGDYSTTVVDPTDDLTMWTIQEYAMAPSNLWGTWWGEMGPYPPPGAYTPLSPVRLMDSRMSGGPLGSGASRNLTVTGGTTGVPANATGVVMNVTATDTTASGFLTAYPAGSSLPLASNLNWIAGQTVPNLVEVPVGAGGAVTFYNSAGSTDVVADLEGYFAPPSGTAGGEVALSPARITDTRPGSGQANAGSTLGAGSTLNVQMTGAGGVPMAGVSAVVLNATVTNTTAASFLTLWPAGLARPTASNLNWVAGWTRPNRVIVPISTSGQISVYNQFGSTDIVLDVSGYFTDATATGKLFTPLSPVRLKDTRSSGQKLDSGGTLTLQVTGAAGVPATASAVILNVTVTNTSAPSFLTVYPSTASSLPLASDLNWVAGQTVPNLTVATLGASGATIFYNAAGSTDIVVDLFGYFS